MDHRPQPVNPTQGSDAINELFECLNSDKVEYVSFDIETNGKNEKITRVIGLAMTCYIDEGFYIPFAEYNKDTKELVSLMPLAEEQELVSILCEILLTKKLIGHNMVYDITVMLASYGIDLTPALYADTIDITLKTNATDKIM